MNIEFVDSHPRRKLEPDLQSLLLTARRLDAAVAFVTRPGVALVRQFLKTHPPGGARLVASVRFPTNLQELAKLQDDFPGTVFLHIGFETPHEKNADRAQFHSKIALLELDEDGRCIVVGSHNWTGCGLQGLNLEAGVILRGQESDPIVAQVRHHIDACAMESEPFDRERLRFYEAVQRALQVGPGNQESRDFPGVEKFDALVIHAEDGTGAALPQPLQLFVPVRDSHSASFFVTNRRVAVYIYPRGTLFGHRPPTAPPRAFVGTVTMANLVRDAAVDRRDVTCRIADLDRPKIELLPERTVPPASGELSQVVLRIEDQDSAELPVFHSAQQPPKMKLDVRSGPTGRRDRNTDENLIHSAELASEFQMPRDLALRTILRVPSPWLYSERTLQQLRFVLHGSDNFDPTMIPLLDLKTPVETMLLNDYVYHVQYRITQEKIAEIERQLKLFRNA